jgi:hypothetical protein
MFEISQILDISSVIKVRFCHFESSHVIWTIYLLLSVTTFLPGWLHVANPVTPLEVIGHEIEQRHQHRRGEHGARLPAISAITSPWKIGSARITVAPATTASAGRGQT